MGGEVEYKTDEYRGEYGDGDGNGEEKYEGDGDGEEFGSCERKGEREGEISVLDGEEEWTGSGVTMI